MDLSKQQKIHEKIKWIILSFAIYSHSIYYDFFFLDDKYYVVNNPLYDGTIASFFKMWLESTSPVVNNIWQFAKLFSSSEPAVFRLFNILFHGLNGYLFSKFLKLKKIKYAGLYSFIFLVHPLQVESVIWISSLKGVIALFFALLFLNYNENQVEKSILKIKKWLFFILGLLSKPVIILYPLWSIIRQKKINIESSLYIIMCGVSFFSFKNNQIELKPEQVSAISQKLIVAFDSSLLYFKKIILPVGISPLYGRNVWYVEELYREKLLIVYLSYIGVFLLCLYLWNRKKEVFYNLLFIVLAFLPVSGLIAHHYEVISIVADRYMYTVLPALLYFVASSFNYDKSKNILVLLIIYFLALNIRQVNMWGKPEKLLSVENEAVEKSYHVKIAKGIQFKEMKNYSKAKMYFEKARRQNNTIESNTFLMEIYNKINDYSSGIALNKGVSDITVKISYADQLTQLLINNEKYTEARTFIDELIERFPYDFNLMKKRYMIKRAKLTRDIYYMEELVKNSRIEKNELLKYQRILNDYKKELKLLEIEYSDYR